MEAPAPNEGCRQGLGPALGTTVKSTDSMEASVGPEGFSGQEAGGGRQQPSGEGVGWCFPGHLMEGRRGQGPDSRRGPPRGLPSRQKPWRRGKG